MILDLICFYEGFSVMLGKKVWMKWVLISRLNNKFWNETTVWLNVICMTPRYFFYACIVRCAAYGAACPRIWLIAPFPWPQNTMHIFNLFLAFFGLVWQKFAPFLHKAGKL